MDDYYGMVGMVPSGSIFDSLRAKSRPHPAEAAGTLVISFLMHFDRTVGSIWQHDSNKIK